MLTRRVLTALAADSTTGRASLSQNLFSYLEYSVHKIRQNIPNEHTVDETKLNAVTSLLDHVSLTGELQQMFQRGLIRQEVLRIIEEAEERMHQCLLVCLREFPHAVERTFTDGSDKLREQNSRLSFKILAVIQQVSKSRDDAVEVNVKDEFNRLLSGLKKCLDVLIM